MIKTVLFSPGHLDMFEPLGIDNYSEEGVLEMYGNDRIVLLTLICNNCIIALAGFMILRKGVVESWVIPGKQIKDYKMRFYKEIKRLIKDVFTKYGLHRMQVYVDREFTRGIKFVAKLGFIYEGIAHKYGIDKKDHVMLGMVK